MFGYEFRPSGVPSGTETPKNPIYCFPANALACTGGEGGIRTLGPPQRGQRVSRPPRSTAPAPLQLNKINDLRLDQNKNSSEVATEVATGCHRMMANPWQVG